MQVCAPHLSRAYCIFAQPANNNVWKRLFQSYGWMIK